tara:strand:+ start:199 stop:441 length:243 start_codon:yes stop_codon:yes gene_type:complete
MNLFLRPLENPNDPVWSVIISLIILLAGTFYYIRIIMTMAYSEMNEPEKVAPTPPDKEVVEQVLEITGLEKIDTGKDLDK